MKNSRISKFKAFEFLCDNRLAVVSTLSYKNNTPQGSLIYYVVNEKFIYFVTPRQSRKLANLNQDNNIALTIFSEIPPLELQLEGTVNSIDDPSLKSRISKIYLENANKNPDTINWPPLFKLPNDQGFIFVKVKIGWYKYSDFSEGESNVIEGTSVDWE